MGGRSPSDDAGKRKPAARKTIVVTGSQMTTPEELWWKINSRSVVLDGYLTILGLRDTPIVFPFSLTATSKAAIGGRAVASDLPQTPHDPAALLLLRDLLTR